MPNLFDIDPSGLEVETELESAPEAKTSSPAGEGEAEAMSGVSFGVK